MLVAYSPPGGGEINGIDAIRRWVTRRWSEATFTMEVREVADHHGETIVRSRYHGSHDRTNLPDEPVISDYFRVEDGKIVSLTVIRNQPSPY